MKKPLWEPSQEEIEKTELTRFSKKIRNIYKLPDTHYSTLHNWSIENPELFWKEIWKDFGLCSSKEWKKVLNIYEFNTNPTKESSDWFDGARLNFAENLLLHGDDQNEAICFTGEDGSRNSISFFELRNAVAKCAYSMKILGVSKMDRVAAVMPNCPD